MNYKAWKIAEDMDGFGKKMEALRDRLQISQDQQNMRTWRQDWVPKSWWIPTNCPGPDSNNEPLCCFIASFAGHSDIYF